MCAISVVFVETGRRSVGKNECSLENYMVALNLKYIRCHAENLVMVGLFDRYTNEPDVRLSALLVIYNRFISEPR